MRTEVSPATNANDDERRSFLVGIAAIVTGALATLFPFAAGWGLVTHPLHRKQNSSDDDSDSAGFVRICPLDALPADGTPRPFAVTADVVDAWTHAPAQKIGSAFLARSAKDPNQLAAFTATCPHLGCAVEYDATAGQFECPCHKSGFAKDGAKLFGPSLRGLDKLPWKIVDNGGTKEVLIKFERFKGGIAESEPIS